MQQFYRLATWIKGKGDALVVDRPTYDDLARVASSALAFPVAGRDIANASQATGIRWSPKIDPMDLVNAKGVAATRRKQRDREIGMLATAIRVLYSQLGATLPTGFDDVLSPGVPHESTGARSSHPPANRAA